MFTIVESVHKYNLGGTLFTEKLSEFLASEFTRQYRTVEISERGKYKLLTAAETAKQVLSIQNVVQCSCESLGGGYDFNCSVSRARYENIIAPLIPEIIRPITEVLNKANIAAEKIAKVVTCGGTLKTPKLQETIRKLLPSTEVINCTPDEVIALGAAKQAGYLTGHTKIPDTLGIDTPSLSTSLQIKVKQDGKESMTHIIPEYSSVPLRKKYEETAISQSITVSLVDKNNKTLGSVSVSNLEPPSKVTIILDISKDGQMHLTLVNQASKEKTHMKYNLTDISKI
ncbi:hypothetical protein RUM44_004551 [Polyplax serrata]|uniref:Uncharacterized protein n=1 Tax=Polyplax serrata TaxID=468196 RepID=A0ABR1B364_POLSC